MRFVTRVLSGYRPPARSNRRSLQDLIAAKAALLVICRRCKHRRVLYPARLLPDLGPDYQVIELRRRLRCRQCGGRAANLHETSR